MRDLPCTSQAPGDAVITGAEGLKVMRGWPCTSPALAGAVLVSDGRVLYVRSESSCSSQTLGIYDAVVCAGFRQD